jgi:hypothetical protein
LRQRLISLETKRWNASALMVSGSAPSPAKLCLSSVDCNALASSLPSRAVISAGVFTGTTRPHQNSAM